MSMLAERRRKTKWVINPRNKPLWYTENDGVQFGKQLMEKMGWSAGKGLGASEQGIQEPIRALFKNDTQGLSFKGNDDTWIKHQDEFNSLLSSLSGEDKSSTLEQAPSQEQAVQSLEEKSKNSKVRVHYKKFTRGKDLSRYTTEDLACILGSKKIEEAVVEEPPEENSNVGSADTSFGVTTINSGSIADYFKSKYKVGQSKPQILERTFDRYKASDEEIVEMRPGFGLGKESEPTPEENDVGDDENVSGTLKSKKRKKSKKQLLEVNETIIIEEEECSKGLTDEVMEVDALNENEGPEVEVVEVEKCRKKKDKRKNPVDEVNATETSMEGIEVEECRKKKKDKRKKSVDEVNATETSIEVIEVDKCRKKKKDKRKNLVDEVKATETSIEVIEVEECRKKKKDKIKNSVDEVKATESNHDNEVPEIEVVEVKKCRKKKGDKGKISVDELQECDIPKIDIEKSRKKKKGKRKNSVDEQSFDANENEECRQGKGYKNSDLAEERSELDEDVAIKTRNDETRKCDGLGQEEKEMLEDAEGTLNSEQQSQCIETKREKRKKRKEREDNETNEADDKVKKKKHKKNEGNEAEVAVETGEEKEESKQKLKNDASYKAEILKPEKSGKKKKIGSEGDGQSKLLGLICDVHLNKFKGSNLDSLNGYGMIRYNKGPN